MSVTVIDLTKHTKHLYTFYECDSSKCLWSDLVHYLQNSLVLPILTPQTANFGFLDSTNTDYISKLLINHILLISKLYVYRSRQKQFIHINKASSLKSKVQKQQKKKLLQVAQKRQ